MKRKPKHNKYPGFVAPRMKNVCPYNHRAEPTRTVRFATADTDECYFDVTLGADGTLKIRFKSNTQQQMSILPQTCNTVEIVGTR